MPAAGTDDDPAAPVGSPHCDYCLAVTGASYLASSLLAAGGTDVAVHWGGGEAPLLPLPPRPGVDALSYESGEHVAVRGRRIQHCVQSLEEIELSDIRRLRPGRPDEGDSAPDGEGGWDHARRLSPPAHTTVAVGRTHSAMPSGLSPHPSPPSAHPPLTSGSAPHAHHQGVPGRSRGRGRRGPSGTQRAGAGGVERHGQDGGSREDAVAHVNSTPCRSSPLRATILTNAGRGDNCFLAGGGGVRPGQVGADAPPVHRGGVRGGPSGHVRRGSSRGRAWPGRGHWARYGPLFGLASGMRLLEIQEGRSGRVEDWPEGDDEACGSACGDGCPGHDGAEGAGMARREVSPPFDYSGKLTAYLRPNRAGDQLEHCVGNPIACEYGKVLAGPHHVIAAQGRRCIREARNSLNDRFLLAVLNIVSHELVEGQLGSQHQQVVMQLDPALAGVLPKARPLPVRGALEQPHSRLLGQRQAVDGVGPLPPERLARERHLAKIPRIEQGGQEKYDVGVEERGLDGGNLLPLHGVARACHGTGGWLSPLWWDEWGLQTRCVSFGWLFLFTKIGHGAAAPGRGAECAGVCELPTTTRQTIEVDTAADSRAGANRSNMFQSGVPYHETGAFKTQGIHGKALRAASGGLNHQPGIVVVAWLSFLMSIAGLSVRAGNTAVSLITTESGTQAGLVVHGGEDVPGETPVESGQRLLKRELGLEVEGSRFKVVCTQTFAFGMREQAPKEHARASGSFRGEILEGNYHPALKYAVGCLLAGKALEEMEECEKKGGSDEELARLTREFFKRRRQVDDVMGTSDQYTLDSPELNYELGVKTEKVGSFSEQPNSYEEEFSLALKLILATTQGHNISSLFFPDHPSPSSVRARDGASPSPFALLRRPTTAASGLLTGLPPNGIGRCSGSLELGSMDAAIPRTPPPHPTAPYTIVLDRRLAREDEPRVEPHEGRHEEAEEEAEEEADEDGPPFIRRGDWESRLRHPALPAPAPLVVAQELPPVHLGLFPLPDVVDLTPCAAGARVPATVPAGRARHAELGLGPPEEDEVHVRRAGGERREGPDDLVPRLPDEAYAPVPLLPVLAVRPAALPARQLAEEVTRRDLAAPLGGTPRLEALHEAEAEAPVGPP
ncbi:hypothetical protein THAOC_29985, partial [Thalassiosira oceanica]